MSKKLEPARWAAIIKDAKRLERLERGAVVTDANGDTWELGWCYWHRINDVKYGKGEVLSDCELAYRGPFTVHHSSRSGATVVGVDPAL